jgi:hypothetical protein
VSGLPARMVSGGPGIQAGAAATFGAITVTTITMSSFLVSSNDLTARNGSAASQVDIGAEGPASQAGVKFGSAGDTNLYRSAADTLKTDDAPSCDRPSHVW